MKRLHSIAIVLAFASSLVAPASAKMMMSHMSMGHMKCPKGQSYTKGYKTKSGTMVKGYCHK